MIGGILSCGITHTLVCPLDIVKCRMQVSIISFLTSKFEINSNNHSLRHTSITIYFLSNSYLDIYFYIFQANPGLYKGVGDGFRTIMADKGIKGFSLVSIIIITFSKIKNTTFKEI